MGDNNYILKIGELTHELEKCKEDVKHWSDLAHIFALVIGLLIPFWLFGVVCLIGLIIL